MRFLDFKAEWNKRRGWKIYALDKESEFESDSESESDYKSESYLESDLESDSESESDYNSPPASEDASVLLCCHQAPFTGLWNKQSYIDYINIVNIWFVIIY